jgi:actin-related protein
MSDSQSNIVIDNGSSTIKCGFSGEEAPKSIFPNVISKSTEKVGDDTLEDNIYPIKHGIITDFDSIEKIWEHTFTRELKVPQEERNILTSDSPLSPKMNRDKMTQIMFEKFNVQGLFICIRPLLSMYCVGKTSGFAPFYVSGRTKQHRRN